ncbi:ATP-grasp domain-containing protein [Methylomicrobium sp. Wu6]|uniref:ATP-grasp domain-containing protein n=1 Tax=Methylomicrobium sp. Wu6 TaxID=3107928 RepID=UPI002DD69492|nr:ATP-grasp domain-containing protein [Methylomicrobium sp. Wu6]MEC4748979.1 ATP-grasp domain-containing protein [Methylomicrobium sp. Wu6]
MKILVFEYISGGGFNRDELPASLAGEGLLMLKALLGGLNEIPELDVTVMLDARLSAQVESPAIEIALIGPQDDCFERFEQLVEQHDAIWPIAPEFDAILFKLCRVVERLGKTLLAPASAAVRLTADKFKTFQCLVGRQIPTVATRLFADCPSFPGESIVKPIDGAGCGDSYLVRDSVDFDRLAACRQGAGRFIIQPHLSGEKTSLSCLFRNGRGWILSVNLQQFEIVNNQYQLSAIRVNHRFDCSLYQDLVAGIAKAVPGLWGCVGIDLIETPAQALVLEINPRLTSSFAGLNAALGVNAAALVLQLLHGDPVIHRTMNKMVTVQIKQKIDGD